MEDYFDDSTQKESNPFDRFLKDPNLDMLNSALPYVSQTVRKPLALYIKATEIQRILSDFDREEVLAACGFEQNSTDPEAMLKAMKMASGGKPTPQIDTILNMMNMIRTYQTFTEFMQNNPEMMQFFNTLMNQKSPGSTGDGGNPQNSPNFSDMLSPQNLSHIAEMMNQPNQMNPLDLLKQFSTGKEGDNTINMLQELLKNTNFPR